MNYIECTDKINSMSIEKIELWVFISKTDKITIVRKKNHIQFLN